MFRNVTPESVGVDSKNLYKLIKRLNKLHMHSFIVAKGNDIFCECYWKPFDKDFNHRMYSVTKSFMSVAVGLCVEDGLIDLDKPVYEYFGDKIKIELSEYTKKQTVRDMLTMTTASFHHSWFWERAYDRTEFYLNDTNKKRPSGTIWEYDSSGSQVLSSLVERVSGKKLFDLLNERIFSKLGTFKNATILKTPNGDSWGDSALICTPRDLLSFARLVLNNGVYECEQLIDESYLKEATKRQKDNSVSAHRDSLHSGYGYQIWKGPMDSFGFVGMGDQLAICVPSKDLIFVCTADNQGSGFSRELIMNGFFEYIVDEISDTSLDVNQEYAKKLEELINSLELYYEKGFDDTPTREKINGVTYVCEENQMGIKNFRFDFKNESEGVLTYENNNGTMVLPFKVNGNSFSKFPELGYSNEYGGVRTQDGFKYDCATSLAWTQVDKITVFSQIIDRYFGNVTFSFAFKGDLAVLHLESIAEDFLWDYQGECVAVKNR
ncbi:MAG: serine hydrolase [Clostridia bacterium]|nr:serine hydrolase [Clostridia bacterium]